MKDLGITTETQSEWKGTAAPVIRKAREKKSTLVQENTGSTGWKDISESLEDTASGLAWVKEKGEHGKRYRIITVQSEGVFSRVPVTTEKVSFG